jgi:tetratricopeptide (TPR) repeat protein
LFLLVESALVKGMNRFFRLFTFGLFVAGASAVCDAGMAPGPGQQQAPRDLSQQPQAQQSPQPNQPQKQQQKGPDAVTPYNEGIAFLKAKKYGAAVPKFEAALKANPNLPQAHLLAAFCLRKLGPANYAASLEHLNAALKLNPSMGEAYESRGVLYVKMGKKEDAEKDLATLKHLNPKLTPGLEAAIKTGKDVDHY